MTHHIGFVAATAMAFTRPAIAAEQPKATGPAREISEIIFQSYPMRALAAGEEGQVFFRVALNASARPTTCQVTQSSGHPLLDAETCELVIKDAVFRSALDANQRLRKGTADGVVNWTIPGHLPAPIQAGAIVPKDPPEKQICKKSVRIGTLAGVERTCMAASEWTKQSEQVRSNWDQLQGRKGNSVCTRAVGSDGLPPPGEYAC